MRERFQDLSSFTRADVDAALARNDPEELALVPITVALVGQDLSVAADVCYRFALHTDSAIRGNAILSFGHLARRFRSLDEGRIKPLLEAALRDPDAVVRASAKSASDEVYQFLHWNIAGHVYG